MDHAWSKMLRWCDDGMHWMDMGALPCNIYENRRRPADAPTRPPSCVARWGEEAVLPLTQVGERSVWCARGHPLQ